VRELNLRSYHIVIKNGILVFVLLSMLSPLEPKWTNEMHCQRIYIFYPTPNHKELLLLLVSLILSNL
jgi:hypothetical protein